MTDVETGSKCSVGEGPDLISKVQKTMSSVEGQAVWDARSLGHMVIRCVAWLLVCLELLLLLGVTGTTLLVGFQGALDFQISVTSIGTVYTNVFGNDAKVRCSICLVSAWECNFLFDEHIVRKEDKSMNVGHGSIRL